MATSPIAIIVMLFCTVIGAFGALFLKKGSARLRFSLRSIFNKYLIFGLSFYGFGSVFAIGALRYGDLSILYPVTSTGYIWITLLSKYKLNEQINRYKVLGIVSIILGVCIIGFAR